jgi:membrane protease YdiL (CAAX protease family)
MDATHADSQLTAEDAVPVPVVPRTQWLLAVLCLGAGVVTLAARGIPGDVPRVIYSVLVAAGLLGVTLVARRQPALRRFWEVSFAFFIFAVVEVLDNGLRAFVTLYIPHAAPVAGNPEASTVLGTVVIQLLQTAFAIVPVIALTLASGGTLRSLYAGIGRPGWWLILPVMSLIGLYFFSLSPRAGLYIPMHGPITFSRLLALTPALLVLVVSNGFQEEFLFRGLFLRKYQTFFRFGVANVLQALIFAFAHAGITYTTSSLLFIVLGVFPLGLVMGYLMRKTNGVVTPALFHAGVDIPIYLAFLTYVS